MKPLLKQKTRRSMEITVITLCLSVLATAQQPKTNDLYEEVPGKWKRVGGGDEITITIKDKNSKVLNLEGLHRDWEGGFFDQSLGKWRFVRHPKPDEIAAYDPVTGKKLPDWVKKRVTRTEKGGELETGGIEWRFTFKVQREARELVLVGEWYRGEVKWKEVTDPQTKKVISQEALAYEADP